MSKSKISTLGPSGTFSESATIHFLKEIDVEGYEIVYQKSILNVLESLHDKNIDLAVIPIENLSEGFIPLAVDYMHEKKHEIKIIGEAKVPVSFSFISNTESISQLFVQFVAEGQCSNFIKRLRGVEIINTQSNIESLETFRASRSDLSGAIVPKNTFKKTNYKYCVEDVTDRKRNETRFLLLSKKNGLYKYKTKKNKSSFLIVDIPNESGALHKILKKFSDRNVNLTSMISRPTGNKFGEYYFFIDVDNSIGDLPIEKSIEEIRKISKIHLLGKY